MCFWVVLERWNIFHFFANFRSGLKKSLAGKNPGDLETLIEKKSIATQALPVLEIGPKSVSAGFFPSFLVSFEVPQKPKLVVRHFFSCKLFSRRRPSRRARASGGLKSGSEATCGAEHKVGCHTVCIVRRYAVHKTYKHTNRQTSRHISPQPGIA